MKEKLKVQPARKTTLDKEAPKPKFAGKAAKRASRMKETKAAGETAFQKKAKAAGLYD